MTYYKKPFTPRKPVRTFRDLEVYQTTLGCSVIMAKDIKPKLVRLKFDFVDNMTQCSMFIPLHISEAHSIRFGDHKAGLLLLERAMAGCNKMIVYLEQAKGIYGSKIGVNSDLLDDIIKRYADVRTKIFRLEKSWQKWTEPKK